MNNSERVKELELRTSLRGKRDDTILKLPSSIFMIEPYINMFRRNFKTNLTEKNKSTIKEVKARLKKFSSSEIDDALKRNKSGTFDGYKELKKNYKEFLKKNQAPEETKKKKINLEELTKKALKKSKEERFAKAREEIKKRRSNKELYDFVEEVKDADEIKRRKLKQKSTGGRKLRQKKLEVLEEIEEVPEKVSRAGQKPPPGSKNSQELIKQLRGVKNFKELTKKALQKLKEDRFAKAREEIKEMRSKKNKPIIKQLTTNIVEPEIIEDINNEIKIFDNINNKMEEKKPREKKKVVITRKKKVKAEEDNSEVDEIMNKMLSDFANLKKEFQPLSIKLERKEPEISLEKEKSLLDEIEEAQKEIQKQADVVMSKLENEKNKILKKQQKRDEKQDKSEFKKEFNKRFSKYMGKKSEFWKTHTEEEAKKLGKKWAKAFNI